MCNSLGNIHKKGKHFTIKSVVFTVFFVIKYKNKVSYVPLRVMSLPHEELTKSQREITSTMNFEKKV